MHNPFLGKCIHGKDGAKFVGGRLTNPDCGHCTPGLNTKQRKHEPHIDCDCGRPGCFQPIEKRDK